MRIVVILLGLLISQSGCASTKASASCKDPQLASIELDSTPSMTLEGVACSLDNDKYLVTLTVLHSGRIVEGKTMGAEGNSYVLSIDNSVDIDGDGILDISVSNGMGRAGDGMTYWLVKSSPPYLTGVGDAPKLAPAGGSQKTIYALIPGGGDILATRIEYQIMNGRLRQTRALQFVFFDEKTVEVRELIQAADEDGAWMQGKSQRISRSEADRCMAGEECLVL